MKVIKDHKLYLRTAKNEARRLDKIAPLIYLKIMEQFLEKDFRAKYVHLNPNLSKPRMCKPLPLRLTTEFRFEFQDLLKAINHPMGIDAIIVTYNGTDLPLVVLTLVK